MQWLPVGHLAKDVNPQSAISNPQWVVVWADNELSVSVTPSTPNGHGITVAETIINAFLLPVFAGRLEGQTGIVRYDDAVEPQGRYDVHATTRWEARHAD